MRRSMFVLVVLAVSLAFAAAASAMAPDQRTFQRQGTQAFDCGTFQDIFTFTTTVHVLTFYDSAGTPVKQVFHVHRVSTDTNSVTGKTLNSSADRIVTFDLITGTVSIDGQNDNTTYPGQGVVVQDVGKVILNADGTVIFEGGQHPNQVGDSFTGADYCSALS
jgi:hypothetical protein